MTKLQSTKPVVRETSVTEKHLPLIVELHPGYLIMRVKGQRTSYSVDYGAVYDLGRKLDWRAQRAEQIKSKRARKEA